MSAFNSVLQTFEVTNTNDSGAGSLFIRVGTVVANQVTFANNEAIGGDGVGGGGRGGRSNRSGAGGGSGGGFNINGGALFTDRNLSVGGSDGRGASRVGQGGSSGNAGGTGVSGVGGAGGGGGGGGGSNPLDRGGRRTALGGAGGSAALGGAIFVNERTDLILLNSNFSGNTTTGGDGANDGQARGNDIFIRDEGSVSQVGTAIDDVFGSVSDFILPTINIAPGNNLSESQSDEIASESAPDVDSSFQLSLDIALPIDLVVNYTITGTAINDPDLFDDEEIDRFDLSIPLSVTIPAGQTTGFIDIDLIDDRIFDPDENIIVTLEDSSLYELGDSTSAEVAIIDDEPVISLNTTDAVEGVSNGQFIFNLDPNAPQGRQLSFSITGGTAELDTDYRLLDGEGNEIEPIDEEGNFSLDISGQEQVAVQLDATGISGGIPDFDDSVAEENETVEITLNELNDEVRPVDDNDEEADENVTFTLNEGEGYELGSTSADIAIEDSGRDDGDDVVGVQIIESQGSTNLIEGQTTDNYTVELTITFTPENFAAPQEVTVTAAIDNEVEEVEFQQIVHNLASDDPIYNGLEVQPLPIAINEFSFDNIEVAGGLNNTLNSIQDSIDAQFRAIELPFIGSLETLAPDLIGTFQTNLINRVQTGGVLDFAELSDLIEETIEEALEVDAVVSRINWKYSQR